MPIETVLFDADGVLIFPWRFAQYLEQAHGITREMTEDFFMGIFEDCLINQADSKEVLPIFLTKWGWKASVDSFIETWFEIENAVDPRVATVIHTLRERSLRCGLATSQEKYRAQYMVEVMKLDRVFDDLFFSCDIGYQKPDTRYFRHIEDALGLQGDLILFWDDSATNVCAARARDWHAEVFTDFKRFKARLGRYLEMNEQWT
jgi:putative hydrolase of the HAD superfamily